MTFTSRGLRLAKALEQYGKNKPLYFDTLNILNKIKFTAITDENLKGTFTVDSSMCNGTDIVHGGFVATLMDVACVYGSLGIKNGKMGLTTNMNINLLKMAKKGETLIVETDFIKKGSMPILEACLTKENGVLVAKGTLSFVYGSDVQQQQCKEMLDFDIFQN